ncbi:MAG: glutamine--fructose-6-phosphate transaminase (isomerizing), partial [Bacteroidia bacterium]
MCGIVGYLGNRDVYPILIKGLRRLEYRGYDSAGVAMINAKGEMNVYKRKGKVSELEAFAVGHDISGNIGIGHTRWATHGEPNDINSHPHYSQSGNLVIIHNGIIENYAAIKEGLKKRGHTFRSQTDTEVLIHLIEEIKEHENMKLGHAVMAALNQVIGAYAIVVMDKNDPDILVAAKKGSPMVIGIGDNEFFIASDASPIVEFTKNVVYLEDEQIAVVRRDKQLKIRNLKDKEITPYVQELTIEMEAIEKGGYDHFMLKEIYEQPRSVKDSMRGRLNAEKGMVSLGGIVEHEAKFKNAKRIIFIACGTSWHAGLVGEYLFEEFARIPVEVEYASEFRYRNPIIYPDDIIIAISQSGETADTLAAIELAKAKGATIVGVCNVVGSSIARATHAGSYTHAGPEIGVASTKAFTA